MVSGALAILEEGAIMENQMEKKTEHDMEIGL